MNLNHMYITRTYPKQGFTLIELLVTIVISGILLAIGVARYVEFNKSELVRSTGQTFKNNLRDIQAKALAGVKPIECGAVPLQSYSVVGIQWNTDLTNCPNIICMKTQAVCGAQLTPITYYKFPPNFDWNGGFAAIVFNFNILGNGISGPNIGATGQTITLRGSISESLTANQYFYKFCINTAGNINDCGFKKGDSTFACTC